MMDLWWLAFYLGAGVVYSLSDYLWKMAQKARKTKERIAQIRVEQEARKANLKELDLKSIARIKALTPELDKIGGPLSDEEKKIRDSLWREKDDSDVFLRLDARYRMAREISDCKGWIEVHQRHYVHYDSDEELVKKLHPWNYDILGRPRWDLLNAITKTYGWPFFVTRIMFQRVSNFVGDRVWERVLRLAGVRP